MAMTAELNRDAKKRKNPFTAKEFMNFLEGDDKKKSGFVESPQSIAARLRTQFFPKAKRIKPKK